MAVAKLSKEEVATAVAATEWTLDGDEITRTYTLKDFKDAMAFVNAVAERAEAANHHPDIAISWNKVTLRLMTHDSGGLTHLDFDLAKEIDAARTVL